MKSLFGFSPLRVGKIPLCEVNGRLHFQEPEYSTVSRFTKSIDNYPQIQITRDMLHPITSGDESRSLFLPVDEPFFKQIARIWYEQGLTDALQLIVERHGNNQPRLASAATYALNVIEFLGNIRDTIYPRVNRNSAYLISSYSPTREWMNSPIRCIAWHPHSSKLAVAAVDDSVRIYTFDSLLVPILKSKYQKNISCIAWRPLSSSEIAIGCESCIVIWTVDPNSVVTRPSTANSIVLRRSNHGPITSLAWGPRGEYLVSASAGDSKLYVWDVALDQTCVLNTVGYVGNTFLLWTKDGSRLISASAGPIFRVWESHRWVAERWHILSGRVQSAAWSPCGTLLLFTTSEETVLYALSFKMASSIFTHETQATPEMALPVMDLSKIEMPRGGVIGGIVQCMEWDPKGRHLAILFKETNYIVVFNTLIYPTIQMSPCCLIPGYPDEIPNLLAFQKEFPEGSCLTIAWSSGRLQFFPIIFSDESNPEAPFKSPNTANTSQLYQSF